MLDIVCLATMIYFEARNQPDVGQIAVAYSAINRAESSDPEFKSTLCDVIFDGCHYSFYCDGLSDTPTNMDAYYKALYIAGVSMLGLVEDPTNGATHYHTKSVYPWWADKLNYVGTFTDHVFYKKYS